MQKFFSNVLTNPLEYIGDNFYRAAQIMLFSIAILLPLAHFRTEIAFGSDELLRVVFWGVGGIALVILVLSFFITKVRQQLYLLLIGVFYLVIFAIGLRVRAFHFEPDLVFMYMFVSALLTFLFYSKVHLVIFQVFAVTYILIMPFFADLNIKLEDQVLLGIQLLAIHLLCYMSVGLRIDRGRLLRKEDIRYSTFFNSISEGIMVVNSQGVFELVNNNLCEMLQRESSELIGNPVSLIFRNSIDQLAQIKTKNDKQIYQEELELIDSKGNEVAVNFSGSQIIDNRGRSRGYIGICSNISQWKSAQDKLVAFSEQLAEANREMEQFSYFASHDLKAPIDTISTFAQYLVKKFKEGDHLDQEARSNLDTILGSAERMNQMVEAVQVFSSSGEDRLFKDWIDSNQLVDDARENLAGYIHANEASISRTTLPKIYGDKTQLTRLFQNLISHSLDQRGDKAPMIEIGAKAVGYDYVFDVSDNGPLLDKKILDKLLDSSQSTRNTLGGRFIGLAICKRILESHKGSIWYEQTGGANHVLFQIPIKRTEAESMHQESKNSDKVNEDF